MILASFMPFRTFPFVAFCSNSGVELKNLLHSLASTVALGSKLGDTTLPLNSTAPTVGFPTKRAGPTFGSDFDKLAFRTCKAGVNCRLYFSQRCSFFELNKTQNGKLNNEPSGTIRIFEPTRYSSIGEIYTEYCFFK